MPGVCGPIFGDRQKRRSQQRLGEQSDKGVFEMERSDWSELRQESSNKNEAPDIPDSDLTDVALRPAKHGQYQLKMKTVWQQQR